MRECFNFLGAVFYPLYDRNCQQLFSYYGTGETNANALLEHRREQTGRQQL